MNPKQRTNLAGGLVLIALGAWFLFLQLAPEGWRLWISAERSWPFFVIGVGVLLLVIGALTGTPGMVIPACIVGGIGGILYWQNATNHWESWSYMWALIPGFVGIGTVLAGLLEGKRKMVWEGGKTMLTSAILFVIFAAFFGGLTGLGPLRDYWPVLLIALGLWALVRPFFAGRSVKSPSENPKGLQDP